MSEPTQTSPANGRGNAPAAEDLSLAGSSSSSGYGEETPSSGNSVTPLQQKPPDHYDQADADNNGSEPTSRRRQARIVAPQNELLLERVEQLSVNDIHADPDVQARARTDDESVTDYAARMKEGDTFPHIVVFGDGTHLWLADGFHRLEATRRAELETITALVKRGGRRDAIKYALGANLGHGLRRTNADKRRAVEIALKEFPDHSDRQIAEMCGVGNQLVGDVRPQVCDSYTSAVRKGRDGKKYPQNVSVKMKRSPVVAPHPARPDSPGSADQEERESHPCITEPAPESGAADTSKVLFSLMDNAKVTADEWTTGWIDAARITGLLCDLERQCRSTSPVAEARCVRRQRALIDLAAALNRRGDLDPAGEDLQDVEDALNTVRNLVRTHPRYPRAEK